MGVVKRAECFVTGVWVPVAAREHWIQFELTLTNGKIVFVGAG